HKVNGRLQWHHFEQLLLLFKNVEVLNGTRLKRLNDIVAQVVQSITREDIERLAEKYNIDPVGERPWEKYVVAGTDDHSGLFVGTCYTEIEVEDYTKAAVLQGLRQGKTRIVGGCDGSLTLAHQINSIAF